MRTLRVEKLICAALEATVTSFRTGRALAEIPVLRMLSMSCDEVSARSSAFVEKFRQRLPGSSLLGLSDGMSVVGGGSCPESQLPTRLITVQSDRHSANEVAASLRLQDPPIILRIEENRVLIDLRTVFPDQEEPLLAGLCRTLHQLATQPQAGGTYPGA